MKEKKFDYRKYIAENKFTLGDVKSKNFENSVINEVSKYKGKEIYPDYLTAKDFGSQITDISQLKKGNLYFLLDTGVNDWQGEYELKKIGSKYFFEDTKGDWGHTSTGKGNDLTYTKDELIDSINNGEIYNQK